MTAPRMTRAEVAAEAAEYRKAYGSGPNRGRTNTGIVSWANARYLMQLARRIRGGTADHSRYRFTWRQMVKQARASVHRAREEDRRKS